MSVGQVFVCLLHILPRFISAKLERGSQNFEFTYGIPMVYSEIDDNNAFIKSLFYPCLLTPAEMLSPCPRLCGEPEPTDAEIQEMIRLMDPVWCLGMWEKMR